MPAFIIFLQTMTRVPPLPAVWTLALFIGIAGFLCGKYKYKVIFLYVPLTLIMVIGFYGDLNNEFIRPAIINELGVSYIYQSYAAMAVALVLPTVGALIGYRKEHARYDGNL